MNIPIQIVVVTLGAFGTLISVIVFVFWNTVNKSNKDAKDMLEHTNSVIDKNTEAYNHLALIVNSIQTKDEGDNRLCDEKHTAIGRTLKRHDEVLIKHDERILKLETRETA